MKMKKGYWLYCLLIVLPIYKDSPLGVVLDSFGYSLVPCICWIVCLWEIFSKKRVVINNILVRRMAVLGIWLLAVSFVGMLIWVIGGNEPYILGEFLPIKIGKVLLIYGAFPIYISLIYNRVVQYSLDEIFKPIYLVVYILTGICCIELMTAPYAFEGLHFKGSFPYSGIRLLTQEPSWTTLLIYNYFMLALYYALLKKKKSILVSIICCEILLVLTSSSKSLLVLVGVSIVLIIFSQKRKMNKTKFTMLMSIIVITMAFFIIFIYPYLERAMVNDILKFTSTATRSYTLLVGYLIGIICPFGVGGVMYLYIFPELLERYMPTFQTIFPSLNLWELEKYLSRGTDDALAPKSGLGLYTMFWGIFGTIYFLKPIWKLYKQSRKINDEYMLVLTIALAGNLIMVALFTEVTYEFLMLLTVMFCLVKRMLCLEGEKFERV